MRSRTPVGRVGPPRPNRYTNRVACALGCKLRDDPAARQRAALTDSAWIVSSSGGARLFHCNSYVTLSIALPGTHVLMISATIGGADSELELLIS